MSQVTATLTVGAFVGTSSFLSVFGTYIVYGQVNISGTLVDMTNVTVQWDRSTATWTFSGTAQAPSAGTLQGFTFMMQATGNTTKFPVLGVGGLNINVNQGDTINITIKATVSEPSTITITVS